MQSLPCPSPDGCELAKGGACKPYGRLNVKIGDDDELGTFIFRTTGFNSIRTLAARLSYYRAVSGNLLACLPLELRLRGKSTTQSHRSAIYYVDLTIREGRTLGEAITEAKQQEARRRENGYDQAALDDAGKLGFSNAAFEFGDDEIPEIMEEFYPDHEGAADVLAEPVTQAHRAGQRRLSLKDRLNAKAVGAGREAKTS
jgi:hypothetical protein